MSTSPILTDQNTSAALPIKKETIHFAVVYTPSEAPETLGRPTKVRHTSSVKDINELKGLKEDGTPNKDKEGNVVPYSGKEVIAFEQDVIRPLAGTLDGFKELVPDSDVQLDIINKGIGSKFNQKIRTMLIEQDDNGGLVFQPTANAYDSTVLIQEAAQRSSANPLDKALKTIQSLPPEQFATIMAQLQAAAAQFSAASAEQPAE